MKEILAFIVGAVCGGFFTLLMFCLVSVRRRASSKIKNRVN